jgi:hypothetical protein
MVRRLHADFRLEKPLRPIGADKTAVANAGGRTIVAIAPENESADRRVQRAERSAPAMADRGSNGSFPATHAQRSAAGPPPLSFVKAPVAKQCFLKPATSDGQRRGEHDASIVGV